MILGAAATIALAVLAQPPAEPAPTPQGEDITVTGQRPIPNTGLVVNIEQIATSCIACRRALNRMQQQAARIRYIIGREGEEVADTMAMADSVGLPPGLTASSAPGSYGQVLSEMRQRAAHGRSVHARRAIANETRPVVAASALYMRNLMRLVTPILERIGQERRASYIYRVGDSRARRSFPEITDVVLRELDRTGADVDLLEGVPALDQARPTRPGARAPR